MHCFINALIGKLDCIGKRTVFCNVLSFNLKCKNRITHSDSHDDSPLRSVVGTLDCELHPPNIHRPCLSPSTHSHKLTTPLANKSHSINATHGDVLRKCCHTKLFIRLRINIISYLESLVHRKWLSFSGSQERFPYSYLPSVD